MYSTFYFFFKLVRLVEKQNERGVFKVAVFDDLLEKLENRVLMDGQFDNLESVLVVRQTKRHLKYW